MWAGVVTLERIEGEVYRTVHNIRTLHTIVISKVKHTAIGIMVPGSLKKEF